MKEIEDKKIDQALMSAQTKTKRNKFNNCKYKEEKKKKREKEG